MGFFNKLKDIADTAVKVSGVIKSAKTDGRQFHDDVFYATGTTYYPDSFKKILKSNKEYKSFPGTIVKNGHAGKRIYEYLYLDTKAKLVPEPTNKHDKNAVKVCIDGKTVGYIKREETLAVKDILKKTQIEYIRAFVSGGKYKIVSLNKDVSDIEDGFSVRINIGYYR